MIELLQKQFFGTGEVSEREFEQISVSDTAYLYKVTLSDGNVYFEVFQRKNSPVCIDFETRVYSETHFKERYPKSNDFGAWAWCIKNYDRAVNKFNSL